MLKKIRAKERKIPAHKGVMTGVREAGLCSGPLDTRKQGGVNLQEPFPFFCLVLFIAVFPAPRLAPAML